MYKMISHLQSVANETALNFTGIHWRLCYAKHKGLWEDKDELSS